MTAHHPITPGVCYKGLPGYPGYCVGDDGSVWSLWKRAGKSCRSRSGVVFVIPSETWERLSLVPDKDGYLQVHLRTGVVGKSIYRKVHHLVLEAFVGPRPGGMEACHDPDPDPANNRPENLRWDTSTGNKLDAVRSGRWTQHYPLLKGEANPSAKLTAPDVIEIRRLFAIGMSGVNLARKFNVSRSVVSRVVNLKAWKHLT